MYTDTWALYINENVYLLAYVPFPCEIILFISYQYFPAFLCTVALKYHVSIFKSFIKGIAVLRFYQILLIAHFAIPLKYILTNHSNHITEITYCWIGKCFHERLLN